MTTLDKMVTPKEDMGLSGFGTAKAKDRCVLVRLEFVAIESPESGAVYLS